MWTHQFPWGRRGEVLKRNPVQLPSNVYFWVKVSSVGSCFTVLGRFLIWAWAYLFSGKWKTNKQTIINLEGEKLKDFSLFLSLPCQFHIHRKVIPWFLVIYNIIDLPFVGCLLVWWLFLLRTLTIFSPSSPYPTMTSDICWWSLVVCVVFLHSNVPLCIKPTPSWEGTLG